MSETVKSLPLSGAEIREALLFKIAHSLEHTCNLRDGDAYGAFSAEILIRLRLDDYGREVKDNHIISAEQGVVEVLGREVETELIIPITPPNQVRMDTEQPLPVETVEKGRKVMRKVKVQAAKGRRAEV